MFQEPNERLDKAVEAMRNSDLREDTLATAEQRIMSQARFRPSAPYKGVVLVAALGAAAVCGVLLLAPSKSYAVELRRIARNGDTGMRHVREWTVQSDGSKKLEHEYYVNGLIARVIYPGGQIWWGDGIQKNLHPDGAVDICHRNGSVALWTGDSAKQILAINSTDPKTKVSVDHGIDWHGRVVDRFTIDGDFVDGRKQTLHSHMVLYADPKTEHPVEMDGTTNFVLPTITEWDYADFDPKLLDLQGGDPTRIYDIDEERDTVKAALTSHGRKVTVKGQTVELLQLWIDETGHAAAIAQASYSRPNNDFGIRVNGEGQVPDPMWKPFSSRYWIQKPTAYKGRPIQIFLDNRESNTPRVASPDAVTVEIPVFDDKSLLGYARFDKVPVHRTWAVGYMLQPLNLPFWGLPGTRYTWDAGSGLRHCLQMFGPSGDAGAVFY